MQEEKNGNARPLGDRVLIKVETIEKTVGGIILPETAHFGDNKVGMVVSTGDGVYTQGGVRIPMTVQVGDRVIMPQSSYDTTKVKLDEVEYILLREQELLMVIR